MELSDWLTTPQAARLLGISAGRLERLRRSGQAPEHTRQDGAWGKIRYSRAAVEAWKPPKNEAPLLMKPSRGYW